MKNNKSKKTLLILSSLATTSAILAPSMLAASCSHDLPKVSIKNNPKVSFINESGQIVVRGSAKEFYEINTKTIFNPIHEKDEKYKLFTDDGKLNNVHDKNHVYKIKPNFYFLDFKNLTAVYDYRIFSFRYDQLVANIPGIATKKQYIQHRNNPKALYLVLYWIEKTSEASSNFESEIVTPSRARFPESLSKIEEAPWAFVRNISTKIKGFWKNVIEPIVVLFEEE